VRQRTTPLQRGCRRTLHRSDHFCRTLWNATSGFELTYTLRLGSRGEPMPTQARKTGVGEARQDRPPAREKHASLSQRSSCCASKRCCLHCCPACGCCCGGPGLMGKPKFLPPSCRPSWRSWVSTQSPTLVDGKQLAACVAPRPCGVRIVPVSCCCCGGAGERGLAMPVMVRSARSRSSSAVCRPSSVCCRLGCELPRFAEAPEIKRHHARHNEGIDAEFVDGATLALGRL